MNNNKNKMPDSIAGAQACLTAIRTMEKLASGTDRDYYQERELMVSTLLNAAEPLSPYMTGFIAVLAEYIDLSLGCGAKPVHHWVPEAAMSDDDVQAGRKQSYASLAA